jgi:hypothetical protein
MEMDSRSVGPGKGALEGLMRERIRAMIEAIVDEELEERRWAPPGRNVWAQFGLDTGTASVSAR